jgi:hypothetical protein
VKKVVLCDRHSAKSLERTVWRSAIHEVDTPPAILAPGLIEASGERVCDAAHIAE